MNETEQEHAGKDPGEGIVRAKTPDPGRPSASVQELGMEDMERHHDLRRGMMKQEYERLEGERRGEPTKQGSVTEQEMNESQDRETARDLARDQARIRDRALKWDKERTDMAHKRRCERWLEWHRMVGVHREFARDYAKYRAGALC